MKPLLTIPVRFADVDSQGHSNHVHILEYIAEGRIALIDGAIKRAGLVDDVDHVLVHVSADFRREIKYHDVLTVWGRVVGIGIKSVGTSFELIRDGEVMAEVSCTNVFFKKSNGKTIPIPEELRNLMNERSG